jgi:hypothetical protein
MTNPHSPGEHEGTPDNARRLTAALSELVGKPVWLVSPSKLNLGSTFILFIGEPIPRSNPSPGSSEGSPLRMNDWEYSVLASSPWRIEGAKGVACTWMDDRSDGGIIKRTLKSLTGAYVTRASSVQPAFDLTIEFSDGKRLSVFNGSASGADEPSWEFSTHDQEFGVSGGGRITVDRRPSLLQ